MRLHLTFSGGLELLFGGQKQQEADVPAKGPQLTAAHLLQWLHDHRLRERPELFLKGNTVRPGVLVLINDADWELAGQLQAELHEGDSVAFISTLHGG